MDVRLQSTALYYIRFALSNLNTQYSQIVDQNYLVRHVVLGKSRIISLPQFESLS